MLFAYSTIALWPGIVEALPSPSSGIPHLNTSYIIWLLQSLLLYFSARWPSVFKRQYWTLKPLLQTYQGILNEKQTFSLFSSLSSPVQCLLAWDISLYLHKSLLIDLNLGGGEDLPYPKGVFQNISVDFSSSKLMKIHVCICVGFTLVFQYKHFLSLWNKLTWKSSNYMKEVSLYSCRERED